MINDNCSRVFQTLMSVNLYVNSFVIKNPLLMYDGKKQKVDLLARDLNNILVKKTTDIRYKFKF